MDGLEEELLEVHNSDEGREPVVGESKVGNGVDEGESDTDDFEFFFTRTPRSVPCPQSRDGYTHLGLESGP